MNKENCALNLVDEIKEYMFMTKWKVVNAVARINARRYVSYIYNVSKVLQNKFGGTFDKV